MKKVLLVFKDEDKCFEYEEMLENDYEVSCCCDIESALTMCAKTTHEAVVYEYDMEENTDYSFLDMIWSISNKVHVVAVTSDMTVEEEVEIIGKNVASYFRDSDDYRLREIKIKRVIENNTRYNFARRAESVKEGIVLEYIHETCYKDGEVLHLSPTEFSVLNVLMSARNFTLTKEFIYSLVFGQILYSSNMTEIDELIYRLRKKLSLTSIVSVQAVGFKWVED